LIPLSKRADSMMKATSQSSAGARKVTVLVEYGRRKGKAQTRIDATGWVDAGLEILRTQSIEHVKVERLAAHLGISKGSFYWHFKNKAELHDAILERWKENSLRDALSVLEQQSVDPHGKLKKLLELSFWSADIPRAADLDLAIRAWARRSLPARRAVARFDAMRVEFIRKIFVNMGFTAADAEARAHLAYPFIRYLNHSLGIGTEEKKRVIRLGYACLVSGGAVPKTLHQKPR
jgi:AcrR family transcriptional regulator